MLNSSTIEQWVIGLLFALVCVVFLLQVKDYHEGKDAFIMAQVTNKEHEHTISDEATSDGDGNITWETVEHDYYWLFYLREDGQRAKYDVGSQILLDRYRIGQQLVVKVRIGRSGREYFSGIDAYLGAEDNETL